MPISGSSGNESIVVEAYSYVLEMRARYNETNGEEGAFIVATNSSFGVDYGNPDDYPIWCAMYAALSEDMMQACKSDPANFSLAMRQHLLNGADHLSSLDGLVAEGRRLNAYGAIYDFINNWRPTQIVEMKMEEFLVYPNPAKGYITIEGTGTVTVINALGQTVLTKEIDGKAKVELPQGLYFVTMGSETRKIVVE